MSVDKYRGTHHINIVTPNEITILLSAQSYRPAVTAALQKIKTFNWKPLQNLIVNRISPGPHPKYGGAYPCLKTKNVGSLIATLEPADYANVDTINNLQDVTVKKGDLLINLTGAGSIGRVSVYYGEDLPITNQHIARMTVKDDYDEAYVAAFLRSWWGERALEQGVAGSTGQINMVNDHVRSVPVVIVDLTAQTYIGSKVRQAELFKWWADKSINSLRGIFEQCYEPFDKFKSSNKIFYTLATKKIFDVMTPESYPPNVSEYFNCNEGVTLGDISSDIFTGKTLSNSEVDNVLQATSRSCSGLFLKPDMNKVARPEDGKYLIKKDILLTNAAHDKRYIGKDVSIHHSDDAILPSAKVLVIRIKSDIYPVAYVHNYLMRPEGYLQWQSIVRGITAGIQPSDVARIRIPKPSLDEKIKDQFYDADNIYIKSGVAGEYAGLLTIAAKYLVEALIEGQITEAELIAAQKALDNGDNSKDRTILSKLTDKGYLAEEGKKLFPDLEKLYELLDEAQQAKDTEVEQGASA